MRRSFSARSRSLIPGKAARPTRGRECSQCILERHRVHRTGRRSRVLVSCIASCCSCRYCREGSYGAIHGRVCYHPCETVCNRAHLDSSVSIHSVERFLGDLASERGWMFEPPSTRSGKRVLVIGAGPSGLSAAYHLARLGHEVEIRDAGALPGGMMRYGIPSYRLPLDVLDVELNRIAMGVHLTCNHRVDDCLPRRLRRINRSVVGVGVMMWPWQTVVSTSCLAGAQPNNARCVCRTTIRRSCRPSDGFPRRRIRHAWTRELRSSATCLGS